MSYIGRKNLIQNPSLSLMLMSLVLFAQEPIYNFKAPVALTRQPHKPMFVVVVGKYSNLNFSMWRLSHSNQKDPWTVPWNFYAAFKNERLSSLVSKYTP